jgi:type IX secretion system PorP/SprF family membrane protein
MTKSLLLCCLCCTFFLKVSAQQDAQFSQYMLMGQYLNPATVGTEGVARFQLINRQQWGAYTGTFDDGGAPATSAFSFNMPLYAIKGGIGLHIVNDVIGPLTNQEVQLSLNYQLKLNDDATLSLGARGGLFNKTLDGSRLRPRDTGDPLIPTGQVKQGNTDFAIGAYYYTSAFYAGISASHLNVAKYDFGLVNASNPQKIHAYLTAGLHYYISDAVELTPSVLVKSDLTQTSVDANMLATYQNKFWFGGGYRVAEGPILLLGINLGKNSEYRIGGAVDFVLNGTSAKAPQSFEFLLGYALPAPRPSKKSPVRTPRFRY